MHRTGSKPLGPTRRAVLTGGVAAAVLGPYRADSAGLAFQLPPQARASEGRISIDGASLWYWDTGGSGEPIILLHPATGSAAIWGYQQPAFAAAGYRVIAYSRRGHFNSPITAGSAPVSAIDDLQSIANALRLDRFHLLGSAAGGFICPDYALSHQDRLLSLIIACSRGGAADPAFNARLSGLTPKGFQEMPASFRELGGSYRITNPAGVAAWEALEHNALIAERVPMRTVNTLDWPGLARIKVPTLMIAGAADLYMPPAAGREFAAHVPGSEVSVLSESGHSAYWEEPARFNQTVIAFLARNRRKGQSGRG